MRQALMPPLQPDKIEKATKGVMALSAGERNVLRIWLTGATSKESARVMNLSHRTVEATRRVILRKFQARNIVQVAGLVAGLESTGPSTARG